MEHAHWNDEELIEQLLTGEPVDTGNCPECRGRLELLTARRERVLRASPAVPEGFLSGRGRASAVVSRRNGRRFRSRLHRHLPRFFFCW
jgi:hypothetical protein